MEWWIILVLILICVALASTISYFILKLYFPLHFAAISYHLHLARLRNASKSQPKIYTTKQPETFLYISDTSCYGVKQKDDWLVYDGTEIVTMNQNRSERKKNGLRSDSTSSIESEGSSFDQLDHLAKSSSPIYGQLEIGLDVDAENSDFIVTILQSMDILCVSPSSRIKIGLTLFPDFVHCRTQPQPLCRYTQFRERFIFHFNLENLPAKYLEIALFVLNEHSEEVDVARSIVKLNEIQLRYPLSMWINLQSLDDTINEQNGMLMLSMNFLPTAKRLTLIIIRAKNIATNPEFADKNLQNYYVVVDVSFYYKKRMVDQKTSSVKPVDTGEVVFNDCFFFTVENINIMKVKVQVKLSLINSQAFNQNQVPSAVDAKRNTIGQVILGAKSSGSELTHWEHVLSYPRQPIAMWHYMRNPVEIVAKADDNKTETPKQIDKDETPDFGDDHGDDQLASVQI